MKQKNVVITGIQNIWNPLTTCYLGCVVTDWSGIQKKQILQAKIPIKCLILHLKHGLPAENYPWCQAQTPAHEQLLFSEFDA